MCFSHRLRFLRSCKAQKAWLKSGTEVRIECKETSWLPQRITAADCKQHSENNVTVEIPHQPVSSAEMMAKKEEEAAGSTPARETETLLALQHLLGSSSLTLQSNL